MTTIFYTTDDGEEHWVEFDDTAVALKAAYDLLWNGTVEFVVVLPLGTTDRIEMRIDRL